MPHPRHFFFCSSGVEGLITTISTFALSIFGIFVKFEEILTFLSYSLIGISNSWSNIVVRRKTLHEVLIISLILFLLILLSRDRLLHCFSINHQLLVLVILSTKLGVVHRLSSVPQLIGTASTSRSTSYSSCEVGCVVTNGAKACCYEVVFSNAVTSLEETDVDWARTLIIRPLSIDSQRENICSFALSYFVNDTRIRYFYLDAFSLSLGRSWHRKTKRSDIFSVGTGIRGGQFNRGITRLRIVAVSFAH